MKGKLHAGAMELAVVQLLGYRRHMVVPNVYWGLGLDHEVDLLAVDGKRQFTEIEIKISKADLKRDRAKLHDHRSKYISRLVFAVPEELVEYARTVIPERAGIISVKWVASWPEGHRRHGEGVWRASWVKMTKHDKKKEPAPAWWDQKLAHLATMRIWTLKEHLANAKANNKRPKP